MKKLHLGKQTFFKKNIETKFLKKTTFDEHSKKICGTKWKTSTHAQHFDLKNVGTKWKPTHMNIWISKCRNLQVPLSSLCLWIYCVGGGYFETPFGGVLIMLYPPEGATANGKNLTEVKHRQTSTTKCAFAVRSVATRVTTMKYW